MPVPEFVLRLREGIAHDLLWLPGASAVVIDAEGRVLLGRRSDTGRWAVPSGIVEPGESPAATVVREVAEETGVRIEVVALTAVAPTGVVEYANRDRAQYLDLCFWCRPLGGEAHVADDESTEVGWFAPDDLPHPLTPSSVERLDRSLEFVAATRRGEHPAPYVAP